MRLENINIKEEDLTKIFPNLKIIDIEGNHNYLESQKTEEKKNREYDLKIKAKNWIIENIGERYQGKSLKNYSAATEKQKKAVNIVDDFLNNLENYLKSGFSLVFIGSAGLGKTHLSAVLCDAVLKLGKNPAYYTAKKLNREVKESWEENKTKESEIIKRFSKYDLLVIDEIGKDYGSETNKFIIEEVFDDRYRKLKSTVLITNISNREDWLKYLGEYVESRILECGKIIVFDGEDYRKKLK